MDANYNLISLPVKNRNPVRVLFLMATTNEYGEELKAIGVKPATIGVGPINAAMNTMAILKNMEHAGELPDLIVNMGSAGSRELEFKAIAQAVSIRYRDIDATPFGFGKGATPFSDLPAKLPIKKIIPNLPGTTVSTGGNVVTGDGYDNLGAQTAEMEAYAVYSASLAFGIPMLKIVGISDGKNNLSGNIDDWTKFLADIDRGLAQAVNNLKEGLADGRISREALLDLPEPLRAIITKRRDTKASPAAI